MPDSPPRPRNALIATWLGLFSVLLYIATARGTLSFGDDASMLAVTRSIATQASVAIPLDTPGACRGVDGRYYSTFNLGQSVLGVPFYLMGAFIAKHYSDPHLRDDPNADAITYFACLLGIFSGAGAVVLLYLTCVELGFSQFAGIFSALAFGTCTFVWFYARTFMTEPTSTLFLMLAFYGLLRFTDVSRLVWLLVSGLGLSLAILVRLQNAITLPVFAVWLMCKVSASWRRELRSGLVAAAVWSAPILASFSVVAIYNYLRFGSAMITGIYTPKTIPLVFDNPWSVGIYGLLLSPGRGVFWYAPILVPAMYGWRFLWRKCPGITAVLGILAGSYLLLYAHFHWWDGGGCWGPRYLVEILPFLMIGLAALINRGLGLIGWIAVGAVAALSFFVQIVSVLVSYIPYLILMARTPDTFARVLWRPAYSPIIVQAGYLLHHTYPYDLAYNAYASAFLAHLQFGALVAAILLFGGGIIMYVCSERGAVSVQSRPAL